MDINKVMVTKNATSETENGKYNIEYRIEDKKIIGIMISIYGIGNNLDEYLGYISVDNGTINSSLNANLKGSDYFIDFENLLLQIKNDASTT